MEMVCFVGLLVFVCGFVVVFLRCLHALAHCAILSNLSIVVMCT